MTISLFHPNLRYLIFPKILFSPRPHHPKSSLSLSLIPTVEGFFFLLSLFPTSPLVPTRIPKLKFFLKKKKEKTQRCHKI